MRASGLFVGARGVPVRRFMRECIFEYLLLRGFFYARTVSRAIRVLDIPRGVTGKCAPG